MTTNERKTVLTIAGSDSSGGAGIQADIKTLTALQVYSASALTAITAQNTTGVQAIHETPGSVVGAQLESVFTDLHVHAVKTGMLPSADIIRRVADYVRRFHVADLVVDPVLVATSGDRLVRDGVVDTLVQQLIPLARVVTPNVAEAQVLSGVHIDSDDDVRAACRVLKHMGCAYVLIKGGHRTGSAAACDVLFDGVCFNAFCAEWVDTRHTHGSGCSLASAIAAGLASGLSVPLAVDRAKRFVLEGIRNGLPVGHGCGPLDHMHTVRPFD